MPSMSKSPSTVRLNEYEVDMVLLLLYTVKFVDSIVSVGVPLMMPVNGSIVRPAGRSGTISNVPPGTRSAGLNDAISVLLSA